MACVSENSRKESAYFIHCNNSICKGSVLYLLITLLKLYRFETKLCLAFFKTISLIVTNIGKNTTLKWKISWLRNR